MHRPLAVLTLPLLLAACGGSSSNSTAQTQAPASRLAIRVLEPVANKVVVAQPLGKRQLRAVVRVAGNAAPGQQLSLRGACGGLDCSGVTFADSAGRWQTRLGLITPKGRTTVKLAVAYADVRAGERPAVVALRFRKAAPPPQAAPQQAPPSKHTPSTGGRPAGGASPYSGPRTMIVIGDSLAVGMAQPLVAALDGWEVPVDGRTGRPLSEGMEILRETPLPAGERGKRAILALGLFTNDGPQNVDALEAAVRESVARLGPHGCAIWATIARPPFGGVSYQAANDRLHSLANDPALAVQLLLVPWQEQYARHPSWRAADNVHATPEGYAARAQMYADAARSCAA